MPWNNSKYSEEMREQTAAYILESGKSATSGQRNWKLIQISYVDGLGIIEKHTIFLSMLRKKDLNQNHQRIMARVIVIKWLSYS